MTHLKRFDEVLHSITKRKKIPVIIFCDPGVDDALMLLQILNQKKYVIAGIIPVRGNASSKTCLENTLALCEYVGRTDIKIYPGQNEKFRGFKVYGQRGLNGLILPAPKTMTAETVNGITFAYHFLKHNKTIIISTAGLTEPAAVLNKLSKHFPHALRNIIGISLMGGVINSTQEANFPIKGKRFTEANIADNPKATKTFFSLSQKYNIPIFLSTLDLTHSVLVSKSDMADLKTKKKNKISQCAYKLICKVPKHYQRRFGKGPVQEFRQPLHDVHATSSLLHPELYQGKWVNVEINKKLAPPHIVIKHEHRGNVFLLSLPTLNRQRFINTIVNDYSSFY